MEKELEYLRKTISALKEEKKVWKQQKVEFEKKISRYDDKILKLNTTIEDLMLKNTALEEEKLEATQSLAYCDLSDLLPPDEDSDFQQHTSADPLSDSEVRETSQRRKKKRRKIPEPEAWEQNINKQKREKGEEYRGKKRVDGVWKYGIPREARKMKPPCKCKKSLNPKGKLHCRKLSEFDRKAFFDRFWSKTRDEKRILVQKCVKVAKTLDTRHRKNEISRRKNSFFFHLPDAEGALKAVCQTQFLNTLGIGAYMVAGMVGNYKPDDEEMKEEQAEEKQEVVRKKQEQSEKRRSILEFLSSLPKMEPHECGNDTSRVYLKTAYATKIEFYNAYKQQYKSPASHTLLYHILDEQKISLFHPQKPQ